MNLLIKNNKLITNIIGLLILFFCFDVYFDYYFTDSIKYYIDELLINLGIKERPKKEPFIGMIASVLGTVGTIMFFGATAVAFIALATSWVINLGIGIGEGKGIGIGIGSGFGLICSSLQFTIIRTNIKVSNFFIIFYL